MRRLPPLNALRAFEAAARLSSVTAAAQELGVTHSAISQQVKQLEDYLGQKLFDRPGRRVEPTPAAIALLEDIRPAFDRIALAAEQLTRRGVRRILTVNASPSFAMHWLIPRIADFQDEHQGLELRVTTSSGGISHLDRPYDAIIRREPMSRAGYVCKALLDDRATAVMHPRLAARRQITQPGQLAELPLLHARSRPDAWKQWFQAQGVATAETLDGPFFDNTALALQAAQKGVGVAMSPIAFVADDIAEGRLMAPFVERVVAGAGFHMLYREATPTERGGRELLKWFDREAAASMPAPLSDAANTNEALGGADTRATSV